MQRATGKIRTMQKLNHAKWNARECGRAKDRRGTVCPLIGCGSKADFASGHLKSPLILPFCSRVQETAVNFR